MGRTQLHYAAGQGALEICEMLVERGADVNALSSGKDSPLHCAVARNRKEVICFLIAQGVVASGKNTVGRKGEQTDG